MKTKMKCASARILGLKICDTCRRFKSITRKCNNCNASFIPTCSYAFSCWDCFSFNRKVKDVYTTTYSVGGR